MESSGTLQLKPTTVDQISYAVKDIDKVVEAWSTEEEPLRLEDVDCDGCTAGGRLHSFCQVCDVRKCGLQREIENCAYCDEFICEKLEKLWKSFQTVSAERAKANLVEIRKRISA